MAKQRCKVHTRHQMNGWEPPVSAVWRHRSLPNAAFGACRLRCQASTTAPYLRRSAYEPMLFASGVHLVLRDNGLRRLIGKSPHEFSRKISKRRKRSLFRFYPIIKGCHCPFSYQVQPVSPDEVVFRHQKTSGERCAEAARLPPLSCEFLASTAKVWPRNFAISATNGER